MLSRPRTRRPHWISLAPPLFAGAALAVLSGVSFSVPGVAAVQPGRSFAWPPSQVRELIAAIEDARSRGLNPADYGLAALRAELDLCERLWETQGSRQLDMLARSAALALARDYRRRVSARPAPVRPAELDAALAAGRVRPWLAAQARAS